MRHKQKRKRERKGERERERGEREKNFRPINAGLYCSLTGFTSLSLYSDFKRCSSFFGSISNLVAEKTDSTTEEREREREREREEKKIS